MALRKHSRWPAPDPTEAVGSCDWHHSNGRRAAFPSLAGISREVGTGWAR